MKQITTKADPAELASAIRIFGAKTHNLRGIDVQIPTGRLTVITGVSGSGKSSLAFDTIYAEGRYRYLSTVSARTRELMQSVDRPDVEFVDGLPPVLCVEQATKGVRKRSTVASTSDIYDYLRLLYARVGKLHCPTCHRPVESQSRSDIVERVLQFEDRQKIIILAPVVRDREGAHGDVFARIVKDGYVRARVDGEIVDAASPPALVKSKPHNIEIVVDRLVLKEGIRSRLEESVDLALQLGRGQCVISRDVDGTWQDRLFSSHLVCTTCGTSFPTIEPRSFSFNSAVGACAKCQGLGVQLLQDESEVDCEECQGTRLSLISRSVLIDGTSITEFCRKTPSDALDTAARWADLFSSYSNEAIHSSEGVRAACQYILPEVSSRLSFLADIGLNYLSLDRSCETLSAGEYQRTRLAACLGQQLTGVCYILDEPTAGLHAREIDRLMNHLTRLRDVGNTVVLVEHDLDVVRQADYVIDLGPGAGTLGGRVIAVGTSDQLSSNPESITGQYLQRRALGKRQGLREPYAEPLTNSTVQPPTANVIRLTGATLHNLKNVTVEFPLRQVVCVTGVSGSGKTSLVIQTLVPAIRRALGERIPAGGPFAELIGSEALAKLVRVDQSPLGRSARSSPATYSGIWDEVRKVFAKTRESRLRGFSAKSFSLGVAEARCPRCSGRGILPVDEKRFADWTIRCPDCDGRRFSSATLSVKYRGKSVADVLELSIIEAANFFQNFPRLAKLLSIFNDLGLGYMKLGQSVTSLSGGEAQRIKLGTELAKSSGLNGATLFVLDEPTSGLHAADVQQLVSVFRRLVAEGHSVLVVEHNQELIAASDWVIEMGPDSGPNGGQVVANRDQREVR